MKGKSFQGWMRRFRMFSPNVHCRKSFQHDNGGAHVALRDKGQRS